jgi:hypothetical protein
MFRLTKTEVNIKTLIKENITTMVKMHNFDILTMVREILKGS